MHMHVHSLLLKNATIIKDCGKAASIVQLSYGISSESSVTLSRI